ncbi:MAG: DUF938 domain-containing protein [Gammaproteobacteria bacterium]|nr:DUF938 domain-containing protein [Gammaproteobacteria bacterium]
MAERPVAISADRNADPILEVLKTEFADCRQVIEIGSGTGQHAAKFAAALPHLSWQTSDVEDHHSGIAAWVEHAALARLSPPITLDVRYDELPRNSYDAVYSSNTAHIMGLDAVEKMFGLVGKSLRPRGVFCLYGPFRRRGEFNTPSNAAFDKSLQLRDASMGIRDLEHLDSFAMQNRLRQKRFYAMPANNHIVVWQKEEE